MEWMVVMLVGAAVSAAGAVSFNVLSDRYTWRQILKQLETESGFECIPSVTGPYAWARAELNGFEIVIVKGGRRGRLFGKTQPTIRIHLKGARGLSLKAVGPVSTRRIFTGCTDFDECVAVGGPETIALSFLDSSTRTRIKRLVNDGGCIENGILEFPVVTDAVTSKHLRRNVDRALQLAKVFSRNPDPIPRIVQALQREQNAHVRDRFLQTLKNHASHDPRFFSLARTLLGAPRAEERLFAVEVLGHEGAGTAELLSTSHEIDIEMRRRALRALVKSLTAEALSEVMKRIAHSAHKDLLPDLMWACQAMENWGPFEVLRERFGDEQSTLKIWESDYLSATRPVDAEERVLELLRGDCATAAEHAAHALGMLGTVQSIHGLLERESSADTVSLKVACEDALEKIRERISLGESGQLSIVDVSQGGGLSVASSVEVKEAEGQHEH